VATDDRFAFLSPRWIDAARRLREEYRHEVPPPPIPVKANVVVTGTPFDGGDVHGHIDTSAGTLLLESGHLDDAELVITTDYDTARELFVGKDPNAAMQAVMKGRIRVTGDVTRLLVLQAPATDATAEALAKEIYERVVAFTE
jgi:hypothetical protein